MQKCEMRTVPKVDTGFWGEAGKKEALKISIGIEFWGEKNFFFLSALLTKV